MPKDSNEDANIDEILAELKGETSEESNDSKDKKEKSITENKDYDEYYDCKDNENEDDYYDKKI